MSIFAVPILPIQTLSGNQPRATRIIEEATQTFAYGAPVSIASGDGGLQIWTANTGANGTLTQGAICGISYEQASSLASTGLGAPTPLTPVVGIGAALGTTKNIQNQAAAVTIFHGAPINDGRCGLFVATTDTIFAATTGNAGALAAPVNTDVGLYYGLTADSGTGVGQHWYIDKSKATQSTSTVVKIVGIDQRQPLTSGGNYQSGALMFFQFDARFVDLIG